MSAFTFRPQVEQLEGRCLPSANPAISISHVTLAEGQSGQMAFVFTVILSEPSSKQVSVKFATADAWGSSGVARAGDDYVPTSGQLKFSPGQTSKTITVQVNGDLTTERDEVFFVNLSGARNATLANQTGVGTIKDDDGYLIPPQPAPEFYWDSASGSWIYPQPGVEDPAASEAQYTL
jgi:hypothetical protein